VLSYAILVDDEPTITGAMIGIGVTKAGVNLKQNVLLTKLILNSSSIFSPVRLF